MSLVGTQKNRDRWGEFGLIQPTHPRTHAPTHASRRTMDGNASRDTEPTGRPADARCDAAWGFVASENHLLPLPLTALTFATVAVNVPQTAQRTNSPTNTQSPGAGRSRCPAAVPPPCLSPLPTYRLSVATARHLAGWLLLIPPSLTGLRTGWYSLSPGSAVPNGPR